MAATECCECGSTEVAWIIRGKGYCDPCGNDKYEIGSAPFYEDDGSDRSS